jgi:hypothetical protein
MFLFSLPRHLRDIRNKKVFEIFVKIGFEDFVTAKIYSFIFVSCFIRPCNLYVDTDVLQIGGVPILCLVDLRLDIIM